MKSKQAYLNFCVYQIKEENYNYCWAMQKSLGVICISEQNFVFNKQIILKVIFITKELFLLKNICTGCSVGQPLNSKNYISGSNTKGNHY